jgi:hypothetical protein
VKGEGVVGATEGQARRASTTSTIASDMLCRYILLFPGLTGRRDGAGCERKEEGRLDVDWDLERSC